jgi:hypothetical protein
MNDDAVRKVAVALLHHPVLGRGGEVLTTTLTNLDIHDMSRCARCYGMHAMYVVHPFESQRLVADRMQRHWVDGPGGKRIPDRATALRVLRVMATLTEATADLGEGGPVEIWTTAARDGEAATTYAEAKQLVSEPGPPVLLLFGTGWGLAESVLAAAARRLEPIRSSRDPSFNHLSVRAACAITLDRLFG